MTGILIAGLLTGCGESSLWGTAPTPTSPDLPVVTLPPTATPDPSLTATPTPLMVLPLRGSPTPGLAPVSVPATPTLPPINTTGPMVRYNSQGGDTLQIVAKRFGVKPEEIISDVNLPALDKLLDPGTLLLVPKRLPEELTPGTLVVPDSDFVNSPSSIGFNIADYVYQQNGYLATYNGETKTYGPTTGIEAVEHNAIDNSLSPRIVLAVLEYESHWVLGQPTNLAQNDYPLGELHPYYRGLFKQLMWAAAELSEGYYRWRSGSLTELTFTDGGTIRLDPRLNAGTAAIQYFFSLNHDRAGWEQAVADNGFPATYRKMFGDPWKRAQPFEPSLPAGLRQPALTLPFEPGKVWAFTNGPHSAWQVPDGSVILQGGALAALDFAPSADASNCIPSEKWVVAPADGIVVRSGKGEVLLDLDGDGYEQTGWDILFLHIAAKDSPTVGATLKAGDHLGHPSCEGGDSTATHLHIARKYNGEWVLAAGAIPFDMDGWIATGNDTPRIGTLVRGDKVIEACTCSTFDTRIIRDK